MGTYCRVITRRKGCAGFDSEEDESATAISQSSDTYAVLAGIKNFNSIVPLFPQRSMEGELKKYEHRYDRDRAWDLFGHCSPWTWFTLVEWDKLDLDRPLEFDKKEKGLPSYLKHRSQSIQPNDTYRTYIQRETSIFEWIEALRADNVELVCLAFD